jgi:hypothetical protein
MSTKITLIFDNPADANAFEAGYPALVTTATTLPELQRLEEWNVWPKEDGSPTPAYRLLDLHFSDYDAASRAVTTAQAGSFFPAAMALATGGVRIVFAQTETT